VDLQILGAVAREQGKPVAGADADRTITALAAAGEQAQVIGEVAAGDRGVVFG